MELVLKIVSSEQHILGESASKTFLPVGGVIGRSRQCDWVIPDQSRHLSGRHAEISSEGEVFFITDISTNGIFVNGADQPMSKNQPLALSSGDTLLMGDMQFTVEVCLDATRNGFAPSASGKVHVGGGLGAPEAAPGYKPSLDPLDILRQKHPQHQGEAAQGFGTVETVAQPAEQNQLDSWHNDSVSMPDGLSAIQETFEAPAMQPETLPEDWNANISETSDALGTPVLRPGNRANVPVIQPVVRPKAAEVRDPFESPVNTPPHVEPMVMDRRPVAAPFPVAEEVAASISMDEHVLAFCRGLGVPADDLTGDTVALMESAGKALKETFSGMVDVMKSRASLKNEFRMDMTLVQVEKNNPLKFAVDDNQIVKHFIGKEKEGFLNIPEAIKESFEDIQEHQVGVMSAMQASLTQLLGKVDPSRLEEKFDRTSTRGFSMVGKKARYWDAYKEYHSDIQQEDSTFSAVFGDTFAVTYKDQVDRLKAAKSTRGNSELGVSVVKSKALEL